MDKGTTKYDEIDLLLDYIDGKLSETLTKDIEHTLTHDEFLNGTVKGLKNLHQEYNGNRHAIRTYLKEAEQRITNNLKTKGIDYPRTSKPSSKNSKYLYFIGIFLLSIIFIVGWLLLGQQKQEINNTKKEQIDILNQPKEITIPPIPKDTVRVQPKENQDNKDSKPTTPPIKDKEKKEKQDTTLDKEPPLMDVPMALNLKGTLTPMPQIEPEIGVTFRSDEEQILTQTTVRDTFYISSQTSNITKIFTFNKPPTLNEFTIEFFNANTPSENASNTFEIKEQKSIFHLKVESGRYYWVLTGDDIDDIYGSFLVILKQ